MNDEDIKQWLINNIKLCNGVTVYGDSEFERVVEFYLIGRKYGFIFDRLRCNQNPKRYYAATMSNLKQRVCRDISQIYGFAVIPDLAEVDR